MIYKIEHFYSVVDNYHQQQMPDISILNRLASTMGEETVLQMAAAYIETVLGRRAGIPPRSWSAATTGALPTQSRSQDGGQSQEKPSYEHISINVGASSPTYTMDPVSPKMPRVLRRPMPNHPSFL